MKTVISRSPRSLDAGSYMSWTAFPFIKQIIHPNWIQLWVVITGNGQVLTGNMTMPLPAQEIRKNRRNGICGLRRSWKSLEGSGKHEDRRWEAGVMNLELGHNNDKT